MGWSRGPIKRSNATAGQHMDQDPGGVTYLKGASSKECIYSLGTHHDKAILSGDSSMAQ
jgi:hypothetical protein